MDSGRLMFQRYKYEKAPVQEAIFEAKFSCEDFDTALPGQFYEKVRSEFPEKNDLKAVMVTIGTASPLEDNQPSSLQTPLLQAWNAERSSCLQIGPGIIAANSLKYQEWESFTPAIKLLLNSYFEYAKPEISKRIGIRYINRFVIPENNVNLSEYFSIGISLPNTLVDSSAFDITLLKSTQFNNYEITTKLRFASDFLKLGENGVVFLLDIDSFVVKNIPTDPKCILQIADFCHDYLENVFESILHDKTRNLLGAKPK